MVTPEASKVEAVRFKEEGNECFNNFHYAEAIDLYSNAILLDPDCAVYHANRSFCHLRLENFGLALEDASNAIKVDPEYVKAYYRKGAAHMALGKYNDALKDFKVVCKMFPKNKMARNKFNACRALRNEAAFALAIETEHGKPLSETIDIDSIVIEDTFDGPVWKEGEPITLDFVRSVAKQFKEQKKIHLKSAYKILVEIIKQLKFLPTVTKVNIPEGGHFTVCGDVHGQYYDLLNIFELNGEPSPENPYHFNGDFVDRGSFSAEVIFLMFCWKLLYPNSFHMTRGNHETINMNTMYGFQGEIITKYDKNTFDLFTEAFDWIPLASVLGGKVLILHGGLFSSDDVTLADLEKVDRNRQPPDSGLMCEMLWSDPSPISGRQPSKRGVGVSFGPDVTNNFLKTNGLDMVVRSHEVKDNGYEVEAECNLVTVFSAPNYCDQMGNKGAFIRFDDHYKPHYVTFDAVPHPHVPPMAFARPAFGASSEIKGIGATSPVTPFYAERRNFRLTSARPFKLSGMMLLLALVSASCFQEVLSKVVGMLFIGEQGVVPEQNTALLETIRLNLGLNSFEYSIPSMGTNNYTLKSVSNGIEKGYYELFSKSVNAEDIVLVGQGAGGAYLQEYLKTSETLFKATIFIASFISRTNRESISKFSPSLSIGGELDGIARITRFMEAFYHQESSDPVVVLGGASHRSFFTGDAPGDIAKYDLSSETDSNSTLNSVAEIIITFIKGIDGHTDLVSNEVSQTTQKLLDPIINMFNEEGFYYFLPPCYEKGVDPKACLQSSPFNSKYAQAVLGGLNFSANSNTDRVWPLEIVFPHDYLPEILNRCQSTTDCVLSTTTVSQAYYTEPETPDFGMTPSASFQMGLKLSSRQKVMEYTGQGTPPFSKTEQQSLCGALGEFTWNHVLQSVPLNARERFERIGSPLVMKPDAEAPFGYYPAWMKGKLSIEKQGRVHTVEAPSVDFATGVPVVGGFHFCKSLSPSKAIEWIYVDGLRQDTIE